MSKDRDKRISPWLVIDETGSENDYESPQEIEDSDSVNEVMHPSSKVAAKDKDNDEVVIVDIDKSNRKASDKDKDEPKNNRTAMRSKRETGNRNKTDVKGGGKSSRIDKTSFPTNAIIIDDDDDDDDEDVKLEKSVPVKNRKRKGSVETVATEKVKTTRASKNKLTIDKFSDDEEEDSDSVVEYLPVRKTARKDKDVINCKGNVRDKDLEANTSAVATEVKKKGFSREADVREEKKSSDTNEIQIIIDDGDDDEDIKVETEVRIKNTKRKGPSRVTTTEQTKIVRATSSKKKLEIVESLSAVDSVEKMNKHENGDSDDVVEYQSYNKAGIKDKDKRPAMDKSKRKASAKGTLPGVTASRNIAVAEVRRKEEEGSSYTEEEILSSNEIAIDDEEDEDITLKTEALAKNTKRKGSLKAPAAKKAKTERAPPSKKILKIDEGNKMENSNSNIANIEWSESDYLSEFNRIEPQIAVNLISLFENDNTIPFIARYRKEMTGGMEPEQLRNIKNTYDNLKLVKQRALVILKSIDKSGKWSPEVHSAVTGAKTMNELELIYAPFKPGAKGSLAERAKELGLASIGNKILRGKAIPSLYSLVDKTKKGLRTEADVRQGIMHIIADVISKDKTTFEGIRKLRKIAVIHIESTKSKAVNSLKTSKTGKSDADLQKYKNYLNFSAAEKAIKDYQILAINRGESQKILTVKLVLPDWFQTDLMNHCLAKYKFVRKVSDFHYTIIEESFKDGYVRLIRPLIVRQVRHDLNERAESASIEVFARNLKKLLLSPPLRGETVLGIDPGFNHGCKLAVISQWGNVLDTATIYPHTKSGTNREHVQVLASLIKKNDCRIVALGNGTACRETERFLTDLIQARVFAPLDVSYTIVDEAGASIYSCSSDAKSEFPHLDPNIISAISIARRLQDPLAELIKIEPQHLGIGMYQRDLPKKQLQLTLDEVITEAVSFVGVDINTASHCLLTKVAGLSPSRAQNIISHRNELGSFSNRQELLNVKGIGPKIFVQCAGFIRISPETALTRDKLSSKELDYLDQTWIHPESYDVARQFIEACGCDLKQLGMGNFIQKVLSYKNGNREILAKKFGTSEHTMDVILKGLTMKKGEDIRIKEDAPLFQRNLRCMDDLCVNTVLTGSVRNVTNFGAFVDIGVGTNGLIPIGKMKGQTLSLGQRVEVVVLSKDKNRGRIALSL